MVPVPVPVVAPDDDDLATQGLVVGDDLCHEVLLRIEAHGRTDEARALLAGDLAWRGGERVVKGR